MASIRLLTTDDAAALRALRLEALRTDPDAFLTTYDEDRLHDEAWFADRIGARARDPACSVHAAFEREAMVGMVGCHRTPQRRAQHKVHVWGMWVAPAARGQGLGRALLEAVFAHLRRLGGIELVLLSVTPGQVGARRLYDGLGFELIGREPRAMKDGERYLDEDHLFLRLGPEAT